MPSPASSSSARTLRGTRALRGAATSAKNAHQLSAAVSSAVLIR